MVNLEKSIYKHSIRAHGGVLTKPEEERQQQNKQFDFLTKFKIVHKNIYVPSKFRSSLVRVWMGFMGKIMMGRASKEDILTELIYCDLIIFNSFYYFKGDCLVF